MKTPLKKDIEIYTEKEMMQRVIIGHPYRPKQNSFLLIKKGCIKVKYRLQTHTLNQSTILNIRPQEVFEFLDIEAGSQIRFLTYSTSFESRKTIKIRRYDVPSFFKSTIQNHYIVKPVEFNEVWNTTEVLRRKLKSSDNTTLKKELIHHLFLAIIYLLGTVVEKYNQLKYVNLSRADNLTRDFIKLVSEHFLNERGVTFYADLLNISPKHLSQTVKECSGRTATELISLAILTEAKILLSNPNSTINQVASELKFSDQYAFSKFFKRECDISPSEFKKIIL